MGFSLQCGTGKQKGMAWEKKKQPNIVEQLRKTFAYGSTCYLPDGPQGHVGMQRK